MSEKRNHVEVIKDVHRLLTREQQALLLAIAEEVIASSQAEGEQSQIAAQEIDRPAQQDA